MVIAAMKPKDAAFLEENYVNLDSIIKQRRHFANKHPSSQSDFQQSSVDVRLNL